MAEEYAAYLAHYGVKNMKWGHRRWQDKNGAYTPAGRIHYHIGDPREKKSISDSSDSPQTKENKSQKRDNDNNISRQESGSTPEDLERNRERARTFLKIAAGVTIAAALAYGGYKGYKHFAPLMDQTVRSGSNLYRVHVDKEDPFVKPFFASGKTDDAVKYTGLLGDVKLRRIETDNREDAAMVNARKKLAALMGKEYVQPPKKLEEIYKSTGQVQSNMRIAGDRAGKKAYEHLLRTDKEFAKAIRERGGAGVNGPFNIMPTDKNPAMRDYKIFNQWLPEHSEKQQELTQKFYAELKKRGYSGVVDVNDRELSGFKAKSAKIIFDTDKIKRVKVNTIVRKQVDRDRNAAERQIRNQTRREEAFSKAAKVAKRVSYGGAAVTGLSFASATAAERSAVRQYKKDHPNTKMTDREILKSLRG